jgi:hypothetical protein
VVLSVIVLAISPNLVPAVFNYFYNSVEIISHLKNSREVFFWTQLIINVTVYTAGLILAIWLPRPIARVVAPNSDAAKRLAALSNDDLRWLRRRCLALGHLAGGISLGLWALTAPAYPIGINLGVDHLPPSVYLHFGMSMILCGLIAAAYPFFCVSCFTVGCCYPPLTRLESMDDRDLKALKSLARWSWLYLILAATVPMLSVAILVLMGSQSRPALALLSVGGIAGLVVALLLFRQLQSDLNALALVATPAESQK